MQAGTQRGLASVKFLIDRMASRFTVQAFATGLLSSFGHNPTIGIRDFEGELGFIPDSYDQAYLRMKFQTTTLDVLDEMKKDDRKKLEEAMYGQVLDVEHFPTALYESREVKVEKPNNGPLIAHVKGELSFHGNTQAQPLDARITDMGTMLRISGEFSILQSDYGIKPFSFAGGALRLKDELKFKFELVARKQDEPATSE